MVGNSCEKKSQVVIGFGDRVSGKGTYYIRDVVQQSYVSSNVVRQVGKESMAMCGAHFCHPQLVL